MSRTRQHAQRKSSGGCRLGAIAILAAAALVAFPAAPGRTTPEGEIFHTFHHTDTQYTFEGSFELAADPACLLNVLFDFDHLKNYVKHAKTATLLREGPRWQDVRYSYRSLFYDAETTFKRVLDAAAGRVDYRLVDITHSGLVDPDIQSISGYYGISRIPTGYRVTFYQQGELEAALLSGFYFYMAKNQAVSFVREIRDYMLSHCPVVTVDADRGHPHD